ncbi:MAG: tyrosine-protein phosphatase [Armatimonadota bacterium]
MIDLHNHLLRYVVKLPVHPTEPDMETAVRMAQIAADDGITTIVSTPHFRPERLGDRVEEMYGIIHSAVDTLNEVLQERGVDVEVLTGAEVSMCEYLPDLAEKGLLPTLGDSRHVLIELPMTTYAAYAEDVLFKLQLKGYQPVLAHFERLAEAPVKRISPRVLHERNIKLQVNCESLQGRRGRKVAELAQNLVKDDLVSALGSDAHDPEDKTPVLTPCRATVERLGGAGTFDRITVQRPMAILGR